MENKMSEEAIELRGELIKYLAAQSWSDEQIEKAISENLTEVNVLCQVFSDLGAK